MPVSLSCTSPRFEGDRIVELWGVGQQIPADSPNENGAF
jgi:hypothetical protein